MFHVLEHNHLKLPTPSSSSSKALHVLPLSPGYLAIIFLDNSLVKYHLPDGTMNKNITLPFRPRKVAVIDYKTIVFTCKENKSIMEIDV